MMDCRNVDFVFTRVGRTRCEPGWGLDRRWGLALRDFDLWMVWAGKGEMTIDGHRLPLHPGVCIWMRPGSIYTATQDEKQRLGVSFIHFDARETKTGARVPYASLPPQALRLPDPAFSEATVLRLLQLQQERRRLSHTGQPFEAHTQRTCNVLLRALMEDLLLFSGRPRGSPDHTLDPVSETHRRIVFDLCREIQEYPGGKYNVQALAEARGYSPDHFTRVFKEMCGRTPQDFILASRIQRAEQLLRETRLQVQEIADRLGYKDVYFFSRQFKQRTGRAPSAVRRGKDVIEKETP